MFSGSITALVTPFDAEDRIDFGALGNLIERQVEGGTSALVIAGTTGEAASFRAGEFDALVRDAVRQVGGRIPVIAGTGTASTDRTIEQTRLAAACGADGVLVVTPYYVRPTQPGLIGHFRAVADAADVPVVLYNVPSRTGVDMQPETVAELSGHDRIVGVKEAVGKMERVDALRRLCGDGFAVLSGDDPTFLDAMRHGAGGVISVASNLVPDLFSALAAAAAAGDWPLAEALDGRLRPLYEALAAETNPIPLKWGMQEAGLCPGRLRLPLVSLSPEYRPAMREALAVLQSSRA